MVIEYSTGVRRDGDKETAPEATLASSLDDTYGDTRGNCGAVTSWLFISLKRPFTRGWGVTHIFRVARHASGAPTRRTTLP